MSYPARAEGLVNSTSLVFKFLAIKLRRVRDDDSKADIYLMKRQEFPTNIEYLKEPMGRQEPM